MESRPTTDVRRELAVEARVLNYENQEAHRQRLPVDITKPLALSVPPTGKGAFILEAKLVEGGEVVGAKAQRFSVMERPVEYPADKSFFGCTNGFMRFPGKSLDDVQETASLLHDLGIKKLRWNEHWTVDWAMVEKEPGRYVFPGRFEKLESVKALGMDNFIAFGTFEGTRCMPEWAKSGRKTLYDYDIPKDLTAYENYCFEVAKRFKGLVKEFELENEPNYVRPENPQQAQDYIETKAAILSAAYRGIKRAMPEAVVIGGTVGVSAFKDLEWLESLLKYAQAKGLKLYDVIAPHYLLRSPGAAPEDMLDRLKFARQLAHTYGLRLWNGENGDSLAAFHNIYPNFTFLADEKRFASQTMRDYLLHKMHGVEHINICFACEWIPPRGVFYFEYESTQAGKLYGMGGFLKPYAVAHATLARRLEGSDFAEQIDLRLKDAWCLAFKRGDETMVATWVKERKATWNVTLPEGVTSVSIVGSTRPLSGPQQLVVSEEPFYLVGKGAVGEKLLAAVKASRLIPEALIELERLSFTSDRKGLEVQVKNHAGQPLKLDSITLSFGQQPVTLTNVTLADELNTVRFAVPTPPERSVLAKVTAVVGGKAHVKEEYVFFPSLESARASGYLIAMKARAPIKVDGDLSEWAEAVPIVVNRKDQVIYADMKAEDLGGWKGLDDLSAVGYLLWDDQTIYFACKVTDDVYANPFTDGISSTWKCDSIQMSFDPLMDNTSADLYYNHDDQEINLALRADGPAYWRRTFGTKYRDKVPGSADGQVPGAKLAVKKWEKGLIYEFAMPIRELYPLQAKPGGTVRFNFIVNDDDGGGRAKWIGVTPGIGERKAPQVFKKLYFAE